jgi:hypothetical protein
MPRRKADYAEDEIREEEIEEVEKEAPVLIPYKRKIANFDKKPYIQIEGYPVLKERDIQKMHDGAAIELYGSFSERPPELTRQRRRSSRSLWGSSGDPCISVSRRTFTKGYAESWEETLGRLLVGQNKRGF